VIPPLVVLILSAPDRVEIDQRLDDLPVVRDRRARQGAQIST
jgi:hypothetical protein